MKINVNVTWLINSKSLDFNIDDGLSEAEQKSHIRALLYDIEIEQNLDFYSRKILDSEVYDDHENFLFEIEDDI